MAQPRNKPVVGLVLTLIVLAVAVYFGGWWIAIAWHRYEMDVAYWRIPKVAGARDDYERHRAALIKLGYFTKHQFYLKRITTRSPEFDDLLKGLQTHFPTRIGKVEAHGYIYGEPTFLVLWINSSRAKEIGDFIQQTDETDPAAAETLK